MTPSLLDANVFIEAKNRYYRFTVCPGFWDWLIAADNSGQIFSIDKIEAELNQMTDGLSAWSKAHTSSFFLPTDDSLQPALARLSRWVTNQQYEQQAINDFFSSADYFLVAHALS